PAARLEQERGGQEGQTAGQQPEGSPELHPAAQGVDDEADERDDQQDRFERHQPPPIELEGYRRVAAIPANWQSPPQWVAVAAVPSACYPHAVCFVRLPA